MNTNVLGRSALIVDDDQDFRIILRKILSKLGVKSFEAENSIQALGVLAETKVDIILLDMNLIYEKGLEFLKTIAGTSLAGIPVIMISSQSDKEAVLSSIAYGAKDYLVKPVDVDAVMRKLAKWLPPSGFLSTIIPPDWGKLVSVGTKARIIAVNSHSIYFEGPVLFDSGSRIVCFGTLKKYVRGESEDLYLVVNSHENSGDTFISFADFHPVFDEIQTNVRSIEKIWKKYEDLKVVSPKKKVNRYTVCILDIDGRIAELATPVVASLGQRVVGFQSIEALSSFLNENQPHVYLIDIRYAEKPSGYQMIRSIKKRLEHGSVGIAVSGDSSNEIVAETLEAGFDFWIPEPDVKSLREMIQEGLRMVSEKTQKIQHEVLYSPPEAFTDADIFFDLSLLEVDEIGVKLWSRSLIRKGTRIIIKQSPSEVDKRLSTLLEDSLEFTVITNGICPLGDQKGYLMFAEFSGERSGFTRFKSGLDRVII